MKRISPYNIIAALFLLVCFSSATPAVAQTTRSTNLTIEQQAAVKRVGNKVASPCKDKECATIKVCEEDVAAWNIVIGLPSGYYPLDPKDPNKKNLCVREGGKVFYTPQIKQTGNPEKHKPTIWYELSIDYKKCPVEITATRLARGQTPDKNEKKAAVTKESSKAALTPKSGNNEDLGLERQ